MHLSTARRTGHWSRTIEKKLCMRILHNDNKKWNSGQCEYQLLSLATRRRLQHTKSHILPAVQQMQCYHIHWRYQKISERALSLTEYLRDVRNWADKPINRHFKNHSTADVWISVLAKIFNWSKICRLLHEEKWIEMLDTKCPDGCNVKVNL